METVIGFNILQLLLDATVVITKEWIKFENEGEEMDVDEYVMWNIYDLSDDYSGVKSDVLICSCSVYVHGMSM